MTPSPAPQPADGERENECAVNDQRICTTHDQYYKLCWPDYMPDWKPMTTPASAEPTEGEQAEAVAARITDEQMTRAILLERRLTSGRLVAHSIALTIAEAMADERAEIVARYEAVAEGMDDESLTPDVAESTTWAAAAARIREAAPK